MYSPIQSGLPQRQAESAGIFLWHPSANQENNCQLFKVYQWMPQSSAEVAHCPENCHLKSYSYCVAPTTISVTT